MLKSLKRWSPLIIGAFMVLTVACGGGEDEAVTPFFEEDLPGRDRLIATASPLPVLDSPGDIPEGLEPVWETFAMLAREYVERESIDPEILARGAIRGLLDALDDPYTSYVTPAGFERQMESFQGDFEGITTHRTASESLWSPRFRTPRRNALESSPETSSSPSMAMIPRVGA